MKEKNLISNELSDEGIFMMAAETAISTVFEEADDDHEYHHDAKVCKKELSKANLDDVAESILGWTLVL